MPGKLTTHVLDTAHGKPAAGLKIELFRHARNRRTLIKTTKTNIDGRTDEPLLEGAALTVGRYELVFHVNAYFTSIESADAGKFLDQVPVIFLVTDRDAKYHVPLLVSPWSYSTYRGS